MSNSAWHWLLQKERLTHTPRSQHMHLPTHSDGLTACRALKPHANDFEMPLRKKILFMHHYQRINEVVLVHFEWGSKATN